MTASLPPAGPPRFSRLADWLDWQQGLHPSAIDLGLERVQRVAARLGVLTPACPVVTVAGTNGKGSCVAYLEAALSAGGYRVGVYTSPHLLRYNERIRIGGREVDDQALVDAFARVDAARGADTLTYFEFGTLAALDLFARANCDVWVLEVGLGGRLDAVNAVDPDVAVITSVGLDHTDWLGPDRDSIGFEKAGIFRADRVAVYGEPDLPNSVRAHAEAIGARLWLAGRDYHWRDEGEGWRFLAPDGGAVTLPPTGLIGPHQRQNAAAALAALAALRSRLPLSAEALAEGVAAARVPGRFQVLPGAVEWILDVAHNRDSAREFAASLAARPAAGRTWAVFAQLRRKELDAVLEPLLPLIDGWWLLELPDGDARPAAEIAAELARRGVAPRGVGRADELFAVVERNADAGDRVVVFGSFRTVEEALRHRGMGGDR